MPAGRTIEFRRRQIPHALGFTRDSRWYCDRLVYGALRSKWAATTINGTDEAACAHLVDAFERWEAPIRNGLWAMRDRGELRSDADVDALALALVAAVQGGLLLTQVRRSTEPLYAAVTAAIEYIRTFAVTPLSAASGGDRPGLRGDPGTHPADRVQDDEQTALPPAAHGASVTTSTRPPPGARPA